MRIGWVCFAVLFLAGVASAAPQRDLLVGRRAPDIELKTLEGKTVKLSALRGRVVVLDFWATWCTPCLKVIPKLNDWHRAHAARGVVVIGIAEDDEADVRAFDDAKLDYPVALDPVQDALRKYRVQGLPMTAIIDKTGVVRFAEAGIGKLDEMDKALATLLK